MGSIFSQCQKHQQYDYNQYTQEKNSTQNKKKSYKLFKKSETSDNKSKKTDINQNNGIPLNSKIHNSIYTHKSSLGMNNGQNSIFNPYQSISINPPSEGIRQSYLIKMNKDPSLLFNNMDNNNIWVLDDSQGSPVKKSYIQSKFKPSQVNFTSQKY